MIKINLSRLLGERKMTQAELARKSGVNKNTVCALYNEFADRISIDTLDRICEVLECELSDLMEYVPNKIPKTGSSLIIDSNSGSAK
jgi:putative transcriptional regulator